MEIQNAKRLFGLKRILTMILAITMPTSLTLVECDTVEVALSEFEYSYNVVEIDSSEIQITFFLGNQSNPIDDLNGFELTFSLDTAISQNSFFSLDVNEGWLSGETASKDVSLNVEGTAVTVSFEVSDCGSASGYGEVFKLNFDDLTEPVHVESIIDNVGGVLIQIDNING